MRWFEGIAAVALGAPLALVAACGSSSADDGGTPARAGTGQAPAGNAGTSGGSGAGGSRAGGGGSAGRGDSGRGGSLSQGGAAGQESTAGKGAEGGTDTGGTSGVRGPALADFCAAWNDAFATFLERCACDAPTVAHYRELGASLCEPGGFLEPLPAAVAAGDLKYDSTAAAALFERLADAAAPCVEEPFRALRLDSKELYSLGGVFIGTHRLGEACAHPVGFKGGVSDCAEGFCASDGGEQGLCISFVGEGEACDGSGTKNFHANVPRLCHETRGPDHDGEYASAFNLLACRPNASGGEATCVRGLGDGEPCEYSDSCQSGRCVDPGNGAAVCAPLIADGEPCEGHTQCASGACELAEPRVCGKPLANGELCAYANSACTSGYCDEAGSGGTVCLPAPTQSVGEPCTLSTDCITEGHGGAREGLCSAGRCVNDICAAYAE